MALENARKTVRTASALLLTALLLLSVPAGAAEHDASKTESGESGEATRINVFYATNRRRDPGRPGVAGYGGDRGPPSFGRCEVEFTPIPFIDQIEFNLPFYLPSETHEVRLAGPVHARFRWDPLLAAVEQTSSRSVVVFVHGYNYGFERTCRMAAEVQRSLRGKATVVMFGWPSNGLPTDYLSDLTDVEWSAPFLARFLAQLGQRLGPARLRVLAHSLGSRGTILALERLAAARRERPLIGRLVLLAPDFDSQAFVERLPGLAPLTGGITLYASSNDAPLKVSRQLNGYPRLGEAGEFLTVAEGMETIDVSAAGRYQILGHEYFFFHPLVAVDLTALLSSGASAAERPGLRRRRREGVVYWEIEETPAP